MSCIQTVTRDAVAVVTLDRAQKQNALDLTMYQELCASLKQAGDDEQARVVVLRSSGPDFCIGEDFDYLADLSRRGELELWRRFYHGFIPVTWHLPKLIIAEVTGRALGIGCELALLADVTYASDEATFGHPEVSLGVTAPTVWPWLAGPKVAKEYLSSGRLMPAAEAARVRLINRVFPSAAVLRQEVDLLASDFAAMPSGTPAANKRILNWAFRDVSRVLLDDLEYTTEFSGLVGSRQVDSDFYEDVRRLGVSEALRTRNARYERS